MDADINFDKKFLELSLSQFINEGLDVAIPLFSKDLKKKISNYVYKLSDFFKVKTSKSKKITFATCQCVFIKKDFFESLGGFNEQIDIGEDIAFFNEVRKKNAKYNILKTSFSASDRRFNKIGIFRVFFASGLMAFIVMTSLYKRKKIQKFIEKIYGGWGNSKPS